MPRFPRREGDIVRFSDEMVSGLKEYSTSFPSCDLSGLQHVREEYEVKKDKQLAALEAYKQATEEKDECLEKLIKKMKRELRRAETDVSDDLDKLERIGWGDNSELTAVPPPGTPRSVQVHRLAKDPSDVTVKWNPPARGSGGSVGFYEIERRERDQDEDEYSEWSIAGVTVETEIRLANQPEGVDLQYRVIAANRIGKSLPTKPAELP